MSLINSKTRNAVWSLSYDIFYVIAAMKASRLIPNFDSVFEVTVEEKKIMAIQSGIFTYRGPKSRRIILSENKP